MNALLFSEHGDVDVLEYGQAPDPKPAHGEVVVRLRAAALNHLDLWIRRGWPGLKLEMPHIGGADGVGEVSAMGEGVDVDGVEVGTRVAISPGFATVEDEFTRRGQHSLSPRFCILGEQCKGTFAEYVAVPAQALLPMPTAADYTETVAAQLTYLTAWRMLVTQGELRAGETVLIVGAGGGVNTAALQIVKLCGADAIVLGGSASKMERALEMGADAVLDYRDDWPKKLHKLTHKQGVDMAVDNVGQATFQKSLAALKRGGRLLTVGNTTGPKAEIDIRYIFSKQLRIIGSTLGTPMEFKRVMGLVWGGKLSPIVDRVMPLSAGAEAQAIMARGEQFGKIVLEIGPT